MSMYKLDEFAKKIGVDKKTLQNWDKQGILIANRTPTGRRVYTEEHYKNYLNQLQLTKKTTDTTVNTETTTNTIVEPENINTKILIKKEDEDFKVSVKHIKKDKYIELSKVKTFKYAKKNAIKKKEEYESIGIEITLETDINEKENSNE